MSQTAFGRLGGVGKTTVLAWEHGTAFPNAAFLAVIAKLGADVGYIVTGSRDYDPPPALTAEEQTLLGHWRGASRETKNATLGALLGVGPARPVATQIYHGQVGQIVKGDAHIGQQTLDLSAAPKRQPRKAKR